MSPILMSKRYTSSATGDLRVVEVNKDGKYVRIVNQTDQDIEIDNYSIQQKVGDYPVAVFRFPPQTKIASCSSVTVWSRQNDALLHQPPAHFVWRQQDRWGSGPEFVTLLCTPCGKVIAWMTAAHRFNKNLVEKMPANQNHHTSTSSSASEDDETTCPTKPVFNGSPKPQVLFQPRKKEKHKIHSFYVQGKNSPGLKDMASNNTQVTFCTNNNCSLEKNSLNINDFSTRQTSPENKKSLSDVDFDATADRPSAFMRPRVRFNVGFQQIRSQHNENFRPPMPKPFSSIP